MCFDFCHSTKWIKCSDYREKNEVKWKERSLETNKCSCQKLDPRAQCRIIIGLNRLDFNNCKVLITPHRSFMTHKLQDFRFNFQVKNWVRTRLSGVQSPSADGDDTTGYGSAGSDTLQWHLCLYRHEVRCPSFRPQQTKDYVLVQSLLWSQRRANVAILRNNRL